MISAVQAEHDSVGHLLESRYAAATVEVAEALRDRKCRSIDNARVIEREVLAGFAAPLDSYSLSVHDKLGNSHSLIYSRLEDLAARVRKYCRRPLGFRSSLPTITRPVRFHFHRNQCGLGDNFALVLAHCCKRFVASSGGDLDKMIGLEYPAANGRSQIDGKQLFQIYAAFGLKLKFAQNAREAGIYAVWMRLSTGKLKVFRSCKNWFDEFRIFCRDENGNIIAEQKFHLMAATRYLLLGPMSRWIVKPVPKAEARPPVIGIWG